MIKTVKGKVIAGVVTVGLLSGGGAAFGATDAGAGLKGWFDGQFKKSEKTIAADTLSHSIAGFAGFAGDVKDLKTGATTDINGTRDTKTGNATAGIDQAGKDYISQVDAAKLEIEGNIDEEFAKIKALADKSLKLTGSLAYGAAQYDLSKHTSKEGRAALAHVESEIEEQTNLSISELEEEIRATKNGLKTLLSQKSGATIENINQAVDTEITRILGKITEKTEELIAAQKTLISNKAAELESTAKQILEEKVNSLINE